LTQLALDKSRGRIGGGGHQSHAAHLAFAHPITGEDVDVSSPLPPHLAAALETARRS
jgi:hypothetical protein